MKCIIDYDEIRKMVEKEVKERIKSDTYCKLLYDKYKDALEFFGEPYLEMFDEQYNEWNISDLEDLINISYKKFCSIIYTDFLEGEVDNITSVIYQILTDVVEYNIKSNCCDDIYNDIKKGEIDCNILKGIVEKVVDRYETEIMERDAVNDISDNIGKYIEYEPNDFLFDLGDIVNTIE